MRNAPRGSPAEDGTWGPGTEGHHHASASIAPEQKGFPGSKPGPHAQPMASVCCSVTWVRWPWGHSGSPSTDLICGSRESLAQTDGVAGVWVGLARLTSLRGQHGFLRCGHFRSVPRFSVAAGPGRSGPRGAPALVAHGDLPLHPSCWAPSDAKEGAGEGTDQSSPGSGDPGIVGAGHTERSEIR